MHYADFAEDDVSFANNLYRSHTDSGESERGADGGHQGIRGKQVEGDRAEGWEARKGRLVRPPRIAIPIS